jgi:NAD(P)-dependent dehydrogenase (short-subunit alcohol dehydrogenase family)
MNPTFDFAGKVVLVTGGARGIGRGLTEAYLEAGARVWILGRNAPPVPVRGPSGHAAQFVAADVRDADQVARAVDTVTTAEGRLDVLVNNAGGSPAADAATVSPRFIASVIALNLTAPFVVAQRCFPALADAPDGGVVVNVASVSGTRPSPGTAAYGAAKAGLLNLTQSLAVEWAPRVRVNALVAGLVATELAETTYGDDASRAAVAATVPLGRFGTPADLASACLFLSSDAARYITGARLEVHGGNEWPAFLTAMKAR